MDRLFGRIGIGCFIAAVVVMAAALMHMVPSGWSWLAVAFALACAAAFTIGITRKPPKKWKKL